MTINLSVTCETPEDLIANVKSLASGMGAAVLHAAAIVPEVPANAGSVVTPEPEGKKPGRKKAPAADAVIEQPKQEPANEDGAPMLTIDQAREMVRGFNSAGHMDEGFKALAELSAKKLSEVDPENAASGKPSAKYAALVARIEALIAEKAA